MNDAPEKIYLQWTRDGDKAADVTWSDDEAGELTCDIGNVAYTRSDVHDKMLCDIIEDLIAYGGEPLCCYEERWKDAVKRGYEAVAATQHGGM